MGLNKNVVLVMVAVAMTFAMWIMPEHISAQTQQKRLLVLTDYANAGMPRLAGVEKFCKGITRADLINTEEKATAQSYKNALASAFNVEANKFVNDAINGDAATQAMKITTPLGIFVGFFALGFIIILVQWMCLCCCCCCPSCCPSKCCQKDENEQYTKCELYWPSIFLILLLLLIIIVSAMGISKAGYFKEGLGDIQCSLSMMLDDVVNGNITTTGSFFIGVTPLITQVNALNSSITTVEGAMGSLNSTLTSLGGTFTTMANNVKNVPNGAGAAATINYLGNIGDTAPATGSTIQSQFVNVLGDSSNSASIVGILYSTLSDTSSTLDSIKTGAAGFKSGISGFQGQIGTINNDLGKVRDQIRDLDDSLSKSLELMDTPKSMGTLVISIIYGVMLGLSVLAMLGVVLMTFCDKYKCRYLMYFSCVILFFLGILGFLLAMIFSIVVPIMYFLCGWLDVTLQASTFAGNTGKFLTDAQVRNIIGTCLIGGTGDIIGAVGGASVRDPINGLKDSVSKTNLFNTTSSFNLITSNLNQITDTLKDFQFGRIIDISDTNAIVTLSSLANPGSGCTALANDGYVPSTRTYTTTYTLPFIPPSISCSLGTVVNSSTCTKTNFEANPTTCKGCIDVGDIFNEWYTNTPPNGTATMANAAAWKSKLDTRYASADPCVGTFTTTFGNVWENYYKRKIDAYSPILGRWKSVSDTSNAASDITQVGNAFTTINGTMGGAISVLQGNVDAITNPKFGMIAGLNCQIIGEDLGLVVGSICVSNFNTIYITRLLMGISAFGILFAMCCIVCSGVRHFKHSERKDRVSPNFMGDKNSFEHTDAAFRP